MPHLVVPRPLHERDLHDELRARPVHAHARKARPLGDTQVLSQNRADDERRSRSASRRWASPSGCAEIGTTMRLRVGAKRVYAVSADSAYVLPRPDGAYPLAIVCNSASHPLRSLVDRYRLCDRRHQRR
jgi:hypothetical protein